MFYKKLLFQLPQNVMFSSMHYLPLLSNCKNVQVISEWKFFLEDKDQLCLKRMSYLYHTSHGQPRFADSSTSCDELDEARRLASLQIKLLEVRWIISLNIVGKHHRLLSTPTCFQPSVLLFTPLHIHGNNMGAGS